MTAPTTETPETPAPAPDDGAERCWLPAEYDAVDAGLRAEEARVPKLLDTWTKRENAPLLVSADAAADADVPARHRAAWVENRRLRIKAELLPDADAMMQSVRRARIGIEQQAAHHSPDAYLVRASLKAGALLQRVAMAPDAGLPALAQEAARTGDVGLAGCVHAVLAQRDGMKSELKRQTGDALARVKIPEREAAVARATAIRNRALALEIALHDRLSGDASSTWKLHAARAMAKPVWSE